jgi:N-acyl-D-aspartate/D-glutamate deacylase
VIGVPFDLVIRNGSVVDGSGLAAYSADVGIADGKIACIGRIKERAIREIDAEGHVVTPGFIDAHAHMDAQVFWDRFGASSCWHGVTTVVMGNCGFTLAPVTVASRPLALRNLERAEDISARAMQEGIEWTWESFAEYLTAVDRCPKGINYAAYLGHSALRTWAMGERAFEAAATEDDMARMTRGLAEALEAGALGLSSSRDSNHLTTDDRPVASRLATWEEVCRLVATMGSLGGGVFELALEEAARSDDARTRADFFARLQALAVGTGVTVTFGVFQIPRRPGRDPDCWRDYLAALEGTAAAGGRMVGQCTSRAMSSVLSFRTQMPFDRLGEWAPVRSLPLDEQKRAFVDPQKRERLVHAARHGDYGQAVGAEAKTPDYTKMRLFEHAWSPRPGPSIAELAAQRRVDPVDLLLDMAVTSDFDQVFVQVNTPDDELLTIMRHPRTVMTFSDTGAHVSQIMDASIQTHLLGYWVRERRALTLEEAVQMLTFALAREWAIPDRGLVREGMVADLNVFDPERIAPAAPTVVADVPGGGKRLEQRAAGILATVVGGHVVIADGAHTGAFPGEVLRGPLARHPHNRTEEPR